MSFEKIKFTQHPADVSGTRGSLRIGKYELSVIGGQRFYCDARRRNQHRLGLEDQTTDPDFWASFEVAVLKQFSQKFDEPFREFTREFFDGATDDVLGWQSREDISNLIQRIEVALTEEEDV